MRWDTLKEKAVLCAVGNETYFCEKAAPWVIQEQVAEGRFGGRDHKDGWRMRSLEMRRKVAKVIENWDVRRAKALVDLFPGAVPKRCLGLVPRCYVADDGKGEWMVEFEEGGGDAER